MRTWLIWSVEHDPKRWKTDDRPSPRRTTIRMLGHERPALPPT
jgi:hypothetical protein